MLTSFQINLSPSDFRHSNLLLTHQITAWQHQVDEVLLTIDLHKSPGRFGSDWEIGKVRLLDFVSSLSGVRVEVVDYSIEARRKVDSEWSGGTQIPMKDFRGGPSYAYFYGLSAARGRYIIHADADIFFGGRSNSWVKEAIDVFESNPDILFLGAYSGAPTPDLRILTLPCEQSSAARGGHRFDFMSTRLFMLDRTRFHQRIGEFKPSRPTLRSVLKACVEGNPAWDLPEHWMTSAMNKANMCRFEFLGSGAGMWYLHPPYRCEDFYSKLPYIIDTIENGKLPDAQLGCHDINDSMVDWTAATDALKKNRWWRRLEHRVFA